MNMNIEEMIPCRVAYIRQIGSYGTGNVQTMERIKNWAKSKNLYDEKTIILAIAHDNPEITLPQNCRYDACIVISNNYEIDEDDYVDQSSISGGKYAVFKIKHTSEEVQQAWYEVFPELLNQGYHIDENKPIFERYVVEMVNNHYCEICIPVYF